jgi:prepilin-type processing-associated H-X9-DG protein
MQAARATRIADVSDGTSNTMALTETLTGVSQADGRGFFYTNRAGCQFLYVSQTPNSTSPDRMHSFTCNSTFNQPTLGVPCTPDDGNTATASARSRHSGGVNVVLCDGSVRFIPDSVSLGTWQAFGWIFDGAPVNLP